MPDSPLLEAPEQLSPAARGEWDRVVAELKSKDLLTDLDRAALAAYCGSYALWAESMVALQKYGAMLKAPSGFPVQSPYVGIANRQAAIMVRLAGEFGFTPATRGKVPGAGSRATFDLFGDPVPANWGRRGRPEHIPTQKNRNKVTLLLAMGWSNERIARALLITPPTLRKCYRAEMRSRDHARDRLDAAMLAKCWELIEVGSVAAMREFRSIVERNDLMTGRVMPVRVVEEEPEPIGKKAQALIDAESAHVGSSWAELMEAKERTAPKPH